METERVAKRLVGLIEKSGAAEGEAFVQSSSGLEMEVRDQAVERLKQRETGGFSMRLVVDHKLAVVTSSDVRDASLERAVARGVELAQTATPDDSNSLPEPAGEAPTVEAYDAGFDSLAFDRKLALLKDLETLAFACDPAIRKMQGISYNDSKDEVVVANTKGVFRRRMTTGFVVGCSVIAERAGDIETGGEEVAARFFDRLDPPSRLATRACRKAVDLLGGRSLPSQSVPVIFDRNVGEALLTHLVAMVTGENVVTGVSALAGRLGDNLGSALVTVVDDATLSGGAASAPFDDEGTPCSPTVVVENGRLKSFLFDTRTARKFGARSTGNAWREGFRTLPTIRTSNLYVAKGTSTREDIIKSTTRGLLVTGLVGWWMGINPSTGDFSSGASGLWIENGEVAYPVKNLTVASNVIDMLRGIDAVGGDLAFTRSTVCPTLRIGEMSVGGT